MAWIESHQQLGRHPKTIKLARLLGVSLPTAVGHLQYLWWWALDYAQDGNLTQYDNEDIAYAMLWNDDAEILVECLCKSGFLDEDDNGNLFIHDWEDYAGLMIERQEAKRISTKERQQKYRDRLKKEAEKNSVTRDNDVSNALVTRDESVSNAPTIPNHTKPNNTNTIPSPKERDKEKETELFERFWSSYPRKVNKKEALKAWNSLKPSEELVSEIIEGVNAWKQSKQWSKDGGQYIPHPATFLRGKRWAERDMVESDPKTFGSGNDYSDFLTNYKPKLRSVAG